MKIIILGAGTLGVQIARELVSEKRDVVIIERNPDVAKGIANELDCLVWIGDGENIETLSDAGVPTCDWFLALTESDETNIVACGLVTETFPGRKTIARARNHFFGSFHNKKRRILGVDHLLNPEAETAEAVSRLIFRGMSPNTIDVKEAGIQLRRVLADEDARFAGKRLQEIRTQIGKDFMVPAIARSGEIIIPGGDFRIESGDYVYLLGEPRHLDRFFGQGTRLSLKMKNLVVFGATALTRRVLKEIGVPGPEMLSSSLHERQKNPDRSALSLLGNPIIKVIGANKEQAKITAMEFPDIEVVLSDFTDEILIDEQGISNADIALCLTSHQNDNLILSLLAKSVGAKQALAVVHNDLYMRLQGDLNIDAIVNQKSVVAGAILDIIRKAHIRRLHSFNEGAFELVELTIGSGFKRKGSTIIDLGLPRGILVAFVIHEGLTAIPTGETAIYENDQVGIVLPKEQMSRLESLFGA